MIILNESSEVRLWRVVPLMLLLAATGCSTSSRKADARDPAYADLTGTYALFQADNPAQGPIGHMRISSQQGRKFSVGIAEPTGNPKVDWEGRGVIDGDKGYYDWDFPDGKKGRTTISIDSKGQLRGQVRGTKINWDYIGRREEGAIRLP